MKVADVESPISRKAMKGGIYSSRLKKRSWDLYSIKVRKASSIKAMTRNVLVIKGTYGFAARFARLKDRESSRTRGVESMERRVSKAAAMAKGGDWR